MGSAYVVHFTLDFENRAQRFNTTLSTRLRKEQLFSFRSHCQKLSASIFFTIPEKNASNVLPGLDNEKEEVSFVQYDSAK